MGAVNNKHYTFVGIVGRDCYFECTCDTKALNNGEHASNGTGQFENCALLLADEPYFASVALVLVGSVQNSSPKLPKTQSDT